MNQLLVTLVILIFFANNIFAKTDKKEFCLNNYNGITKIVDPFYINSKNKTIYFDTIEKYSKYIGPTWFGVAYCGYNTIVNNVGHYFKYIGDDVNQSIDTISTEISDRSDEAKTEGVFEEDDMYNNDENEVFIVNKLIDPEKPLKCVPLNSVNPAYSPYHPLMIKTTNRERANIINNMGTVYGGNSNKIMEFFKDSKDIQPCGTVMKMRDSSISCSVRVSNTIDESVTITDSNGKTYHQAYGVVYSDINLFSDDINTVLELSVSSTESIRTTSDSYSTVKSEGESHSQSENWSDTYTDSTGINNTWTTSDGYSDSHTQGHSETTTEENKGWSFESSNTNSASNSYSYGKSNTISHTNDISTDQSIEVSAERLYQKSVSRSNTKEHNKTLEFHIPDNDCYNLTPVPLFRSESTVVSTILTSTITSIILPTFSPTTSTTTNISSITTKDINPTQSIDLQFIPLTFKGIQNGNSSIFLSVPKLGTDEAFDMKIFDSYYYTWFVTSTPITLDNFKDIKYLFTYV
ncbi:hypothetical protein BCR36DRAFT_417231 [Piromyces finnis]|uniref:Uncharacterized protein n=1 Tax=Piromyces finnis TaxID=1754191 RepID=A0A1Y1U9Z8_9FUNG|nr:hypothetical protein BCR36DRAFT_417231 [Piromyces finnis]|eukprot:ORX34337.1 hypothetical protein BCR36DRAFT_417231 [Piromyces finnis]